MKIVIIVIVLAVLGIGAYWVLGGPANEPAIIPQEEGTVLTPTGGVEAATTVVTYTNSGFSPNTVTVRVGDSVRFENASTLEMWIGSDDHPDHTGYSGTEREDHCPDATGTAFDQCGVGKSFTFTFTKAGTWGYHNHRVDEDGGTVIVTQ